jgi:uncharacterized protein YhbP (UPF0306 family)
VNNFNPQILTKRYLSKALIMQLATSRGGQSWICNLHFINDKNSNIYWLSQTRRRHSEDIKTNSNIAIAVVVRPDKPLVGVQAEGVGEIVTNVDELKTVMTSYVERHGTDKSFAESIVAGTNEHRLYKFTPRFFSLYDEINFVEQPSQSWAPENK